MSTAHFHSSQRVTCIQAVPAMGLEVGFTGTIIQAEDYVPGLDAGNVSVSVDQFPAASPYGHTAASYWTDSEALKVWTPITEKETPTMPARSAAATADQALLEDIETFLRRFVIFPEKDYYRVVALWIIHTYTLQAGIPYCTPYLYVNSAEKQSGKTRTIETVELLAHNPVTAAGITPASLYRLIESNRPTLFIDEADAIFAGAANEDLRRVLNSGYKKNGNELRFVPGPDGGETRPFSTFTPKLLAGINNGAMPDTIADRCIFLNLKRKKTSENVERLIERKIIDDVNALRTRIQDWVTHNTNALLDMEPDPIDGISDRANEITEPLLAIAMRFKGQMKPAREMFARVMAPKKEKLSLNAEALLIARNLMDGEEGTSPRDRITSAELASALDISTKRLGILLAPYEITPGTIRLGGGVTAKGYYRRDFQDSWERYL